MDAVIFDIGGVLINWVPERAFEQVMPADQVGPFMERVGFHDWNRANDALPSIAASEAELAARFPADADSIRAYRTHFLHTIAEEVPGTGAVVAELSAAGVTVLALTNWAADMFAVGRERFGILRRFADIVVSGAEGIVKPDPAIYSLACRRAGVQPADAVFVDDVAANIAGAQDVGLTGLLFTSADALREDLVRLGLLGPREPVTVPTYHWAVKADWQDAVAEGSWPWSGRGLTYLGEGFVHLSFADQLAGTRERFYADLADDELVLLRLDPSDDLPILVEDGFPHLFAPLPLDRVVQASAPA
ncbi:MAG: HAD-IA family hydrolase [Actinobacteria bacterium]|nr:HAD-IA family hydrolase [Actinomycetota bacterium]